MIPAGVSIRRLTDEGIRHGGDHSYGKDADRKTGPSPCLPKSYGRRAEGYGPQGRGPRYLLLRLGNWWNPKSAAELIFYLTGFPVRLQRASPTCSTISPWLLYT